MTAPKPSDSRGHNGTWHALAELSVPSEPGNERHATEVVAGAIKGVGLAGQRLERLKTAVAEATMNATGGRPPLERGKGACGSE